MHTHKTSAYTRTELLVSVATFGALVFLLPALVAPWLHHSRALKCQDNLREISGGLARFRRSTGGYFPPRWAPQNVGGTTNHWRWYWTLEAAMTGSTEFPPHRFQAVPRMQSSKLLGSEWHCPSARMRIGPEAVTFQSYGYNSDGLQSYVSQPGLGLGIKTFPDGMKGPVNESDIVNPSMMLALGDGARSWGGKLCMSSDLGRTQPDREQVIPLRFDTNRHRGDLNVAFADGRVQAMSMRTLFEDTSDGALRIWNRDNLPHRERLE